MEIKLFTIIIDSKFFELDIISIKTKSINNSLFYIGRLGKCINVHLFFINIFSNY
jgi:hypothetical protein